MYMKKYIFLLLLLSGFIISYAQVKNKTIRAGLFTSLYLDSSFDATGNYKLNNNFPRQAIAGLEFYEGAVFAIDSLNEIGIPVKLEVYDIKSRQGNIDNLIKKGKLDSLDLMILYGGPPEYIELAKISKQKNIPLVSASYPNDGGIRENPMVFIANPKINTHLQVIIDQLESRWNAANVVWFKTSDPGDNRLQEIFKHSIELSRSKIKPRYINLGGTFSTQEISQALDTSKINVLIAGSLTNNFALNFARSISFIEKKGIIQVIGLPNWNGLKEIESPSYAGIPIYFTSEMSARRDNKWANAFEEKIREATGLQSSATAIKGFELTFYFLNILSKHGRVNTDDPSDNIFKVFNELDFRPTKSTDNSILPDFIENKKVYFIRRLNGVESNQ